MSNFSMRQLLEAGVHYGHTTRRWNPKMRHYIYGVRNGIHILDLDQTVPMLSRALKFVHETASAGGRVLFVGTKIQASPIIADAANKCGQYYVNHRWLGGMMTNWKTISNSIRSLKDLTEKLSGDNSLLTKKELLNLEREHEKLDRSLGGIKDMGGIPDLLFVVDTNKEAIAIQEANKLSIPVVAIVDSNSNPEGITFPIPGNDDAIRAIQLYCDLISGSILSGAQRQRSARGEDLGAAANVDAIADEIPAEESKGNVAQSKGQTSKVAADAVEKVAPKPEKAPAEKAAEPKKETAAKKAPAKKPAAKKPAAKKEVAEKKEAAPKKAPAKKPAAKKPAAKKAEVKK